jgi:hypothetical protein
MAPQRAALAARRAALAAPLMYQREKPSSGEDH